MRKTLLLFSFFGFISVIYGKLGFFSDYNRPSQWNEDLSDEEYKKIEDFVNYLRKRAEAAEAATLDGKDEGKELQSHSEPYAHSENPSFIYSLPSVKPKDTFDAEFAVGPSDPRYYQDVGKPPGSVNTPKKKDSLQQVTTDSLLESSAERDELEEKDYSPYHSAVYQSPVSDIIEADERSDIYFTAIVAGCSAAAVFAVVVIGIGCYRLQKNAKAAAEVDYPAYGVTGPHKDVSPTSGDRRLAQSAQMYHYQHQKQQIIAMESRANNERHGSISDAESDEENEEGDYTVYECPGFASTGEMEVKNPLFQDDQTPATPVKVGSQQSTKPADELHNLIIL